MFVYCVVTLLLLPLALDEMYLVVLKSYPWPFAFLFLTCNKNRESRELLMAESGYRQRLVSPILEMRVVH